MDSLQIHATCSGRSNSKLKFNDITYLPAVIAVPYRLESLATAVTELFNPVSSKKPRSALQDIAMNYCQHSQILNNSKFVATKLLFSSV